MRLSSPSLVLVSLVAGCDGSGARLHDGGIGDASVRVDAAAVDAAAVDAAGDADAQPPALSCNGPFDPGAMHTQYVAHSLSLPVTAVTIASYGLNLDGDPDGRPDNGLGRAMAAYYAESGFNPQTQLDTALAAGDALQLFDVEATSLVTALGVVLFHAPGADCDDPPDPADDFDGNEVLSVLDPARSNRLSGQIVGGLFRGGPGEIDIRLPLFGPTPVRLRLIGARAEIRAVEAGTLSAGKLGGAVPVAVLHATVLPAMAASMQQVIDAECTSVPPSCCPAASRAESYLTMFDADGDCTITATEIRDEPRGLFQPDVDLLDSNQGDIYAPRQDGIKDSLSIGIGFAAVGANFERR